MESSIECCWYISRCTVWELFYGTTYTKYLDLLNCPDHYCQSRKMLERASGRICYYKQFDSRSGTFNVYTHWFQIDRLYARPMYLYCIVHSRTTASFWHVRKHIARIIYTPYSRVHSTSSSLPMENRRKSRRRGGCSHPKNIPRDINFVHSAITHIVSMMSLAVFATYTRALL